MMRSHTLALRFISVSAAFFMLQAPASGQDGELTEEELRTLIEQGNWEALGLVETPPRSPETHDAKLEAIRSHRDGSLELAEEMLSTGDVGVQRDVLHALRSYDTQDALDLLREQAGRMSLLVPTRDAVQIAWVRVFRNKLGDLSDDRAIAMIEDPATEDLDRALHLLVLASSDRELALRIYSRYLEDTSPAVRLSALMVNRAHGERRLGRLLAVDEDVLLARASRSAPRARSARPGRACGGPPGAGAG